MLAYFHAEHAKWGERNNLYVNAANDCDEDYEIPSWPDMPSLHP